MTAVISSQIQSLPPLPESVVSLQRLGRDGEVTCAALAEILERDPMLTASVLKAANSSIYGFGGRIRSLKHAVAMLGTTMVRGLVMAAALRQTLTMDMSPYGLTNDAFAYLATVQSALTNHWLSRDRAIDTETLVTASFIMELGKILVADGVRRADLTAEFQAALATPEDIEAVEQRLVGVDSRALAASMFEYWHLEGDLVAAIAHMSPEAPTRGHAAELGTILRIVATCASVRGSFGVDQVQRALALARQAGLDPDRLEAAIAVVDITSLGDRRP